MNRLNLSRLDTIAFKRVVKDSLSRLDAGNGRKNTSAERILMAKGLVFQQVGYLKNTALKHRRLTPRR